jgi:hypothetical protein
MREDFNKIVNDAGRTRRGAKSKKTGRKLNLHELRKEDQNSVARTKESKRGQYGYDSKAHITNLAPLEGFLKKSVGRPWNKIYSELRERIDPRTKTGDHILKQLGWLVETNCYLAVDKKVYESIGSKHSVMDNEVSGFYVHPITHLLCYQKRRREYSQDRQHMAKNIRVIIINPDCEYRLQETSVPDPNREWYYLTKSEWHKASYRTLKHAEVLRTGWEPEKEYPAGTRICEQP